MCKENSAIAASWSGIQHLEAFFDMAASDLTVYTVDVPRYLTNIKIPLLPGKRSLYQRLSESDEEGSNGI